MKLKFISDVVYKVKFLLGSSIRKIPLMVSLFIFLSVIDILGIGLIAPYIMLIISPNLILETNIYKFFVDVGLTSNLDSLLIILSLLLFTVFLFKSILGILVNKMILQFCVSHGAQLRAFLMNSYQNMQYEEYISRNSSEYIYRI